MRMDEVRTSFSESHHVGDRNPLCQQMRSVLHVVEVGVEERDRVPGLDLDQCIQAIGAGRLVNWVFRKQLKSDVVVRVAGLLGDLRKPIEDSSTPTTSASIERMTASVDALPPYSML